MFQLDYELERGAESPSGQRLCHRDIWSTREPIKNQSAPVEIMLVIESHPFVVQLLISKRLLSFENFMNVVEYWRRNPGSLVIE